MNIFNKINASQSTENIHKYKRLEALFNDVL